MLDYHLAFLAPSLPLPTPLLPPCYDIPKKWAVRQKEHQRRTKGAPKGGAPKI